MSEDMGAIDEFLRHTPPDARRHVAKLIHGDHEPLPSVRTSIERHLSLCRSQSVDNEFVDVELAETIGEVLLRLSQLIDANDAAACAVLGAAARYYVEAEDGAHDFDSLVGFEDDAQVAVAACHALGADAVGRPLAGYLIR